MQNIIFEDQSYSNVDALHLSFTDFDESELPSSLVSEGSVSLNFVKDSSWSNKVEQINDTSRMMASERKGSASKATDRVNSCENSCQDSNLIQATQSTTYQIKEMLKQMASERRSKKSSFNQLSSEVQLISVKDIQRSDSAS